MSARRSASCLVVYLLLCSSQALENITAVVGQEVTLPCKVNNNSFIMAVEWSRPELDLEYVLLYRTGSFVPYSQIPSYVNRTDLQDREMKDGDVSMILKDVKMEDRGTYECRVFQIKANRTKRAILNSDPISIIYLVVGPSGDKDGGDKDGGGKDRNTDGNTGDGGNKVGIILGVVGVIVLLAVASVGFLVYRRHKRQNSNLPGEQML